MIDRPDPPSEAPEFPLEDAPAVETQTEVAPDLEPATRTALLDAPPQGRRVYLASPLEYTDAGRLWQSSVLAPAVAGAGFDLLDPQGAADALLAAPTDMPEGVERIVALTTANLEVGRRNRALLDGADAVLAVLDGADVDSGTAAEIGYAFARGKPVVGLRTDTRQTAENAATTVNLQVESFVVESGGAVVTALEAALAELDRILP